MNKNSGLTQSLSKTASAWVQATTLMLCLPFDVARHQYAMAQRLGLIERSLLAWAQFERALVAMECWTLGPWARHRR